MRACILTIFIVISSNVFSQQRSPADKPAPPPGALRAHLVALNVSSLDRSVAWYSGHFGFAVKDRKEFPNAGLRIAMLERDGFWLEMVEKKSSFPTTRIQARMPEIKDWDDVQGIKKLAFAVDDIDRYIADFKRTGVRFQLSLRGNPDDPIFGRSAIVLDDDGNWIQLCELKR